MSVPRTRAILIGIGAVLWSLQASFTSAADWSSLLRQADSYRLFRAGGFSFDYVLNDGGTRTVMKIYLKRDDPHVVIGRYIEPPRLSGRKILVADNSFWLLDRYMRDPIRISARQLLFGQAAAGDITRLTYSGSYTVASGAFQGNEAVLDLAAIPGAGATYPRVTLTLEKSTSRPLAAKLYGASGTLLKTLSYDSYASVGGKQILTGFKITNMLTGSTSTIILENYSDQTLPARYFSREGIRELR